MNSRAGRHACRDVAASPGVMGVCVWGREGKVGGCYPTRQPEKGNAAGAHVDNVSLSLFEPKQQSLKFICDLAASSSGMSPMQVSVEDKKGPDPLGKMTPPQTLKDAYIAVIGPPGTAKTSFIQQCIGKEAEVPSSHGSQARDYTFTYNDKHNGAYHTHLVDTPGLDTEVSDKTADVGAALRNFLGWLTEMVKSGKQLSGIVFLQPITASKPLNASVLSVLMCSKLYGKSFHECVALVTTRWSDVATAEGQHLERELMQNCEFFQTMIASGSKTFQFHDTEKSARAAISHILSRSAAIMDMEPISMGMSDDEVEQMMASTRRLDSDFTLAHDSFDMYSPDSALGLDWSADADGFDGQISFDDSQTPSVPVELALLNLNESIGELGAHENEMRHLYREQIRKFRKELDNGLQDWQLELGKEISDFTETEREIWERFQQLKEEYDNFRLAAEKDREKAREEALRLQKEQLEQHKKQLDEENLRHEKERKESQELRAAELKDIRALHSQELKDDRDRQAKELESVREDHRKQLETLREDHKQQHADSLRLKEVEIQSVRDALLRDSDERAKSLVKEMSDMKMTLESQHTDEMKRVREDMERQAAAEKLVLEQELQAAAKEKEDIMQKATEREKTLVDQANKDKHDLLEEITRLGASLEVEKAKVQDEMSKTITEMEQRYKKELDDVRKEVEAAKTESIRQVNHIRMAASRRIQERERTIADQVKIMLAESKRLREESLREVRQEIERLEKERVEREEMHKKALADAQAKASKTRLFRRN
ncbi:hypothetical protein QBC35DRAFT_531323 [Podospora australis]|uniref:G domain-containing protein n=1 Tax=Podospora australis TaxID=1536484 RepID=A0AAN6WVE2_9PEZI|nr:hypothetical protein QBC35DRAFT_531323 [Podospora australis]